ncbi:hypothetical protein ACIBF5_19535 [Micromonospora sp. NPDC050417]|uniref:hypothetical protein n=1 Tax=Micromonospora sp. NPDC050417 TaxID=3364280 RepID=UPI0037A086E5
MVYDDPGPRGTPSCMDMSREASSVGDVRDTGPVPRRRLDEVVGLGAVASLALE